LASRIDGGRIAHPTAGCAFRWKYGREFAGPEPGEEIEQDLDDTEQFVADQQHHRLGDPTFLTARGDALAHVVEDALHAVVGVRGDGVGHLVSNSC
jgi:hypothetical protein